MSKLVKVTIKGIHEIENDKNIIEDTYQGEYSLRNDTHYIMYEEQTEYGIIKNMLKVNGEDICLTKKGAMNSRMIFENGNITKCDYGTAYGQMLLDIKTKNITINLDKNKECAKLVIDYEILSDDIVVDACMLSIELTDRI